MRKTKDNDLADRRSSAAAAKAALLQAYRARHEAAKPTRLAHQEERLALAAANRERQSAREDREVKEQEQELITAQAAEREASADATARAEVEARASADNPSSRAIEPEAARKAERDRRYADRRARQR